MTTQTTEPDRAAADWSKLRQQFPAANGCAYLNTASRGLIPTAAAQTGQNYFARMHLDAVVGLGSVWADALEQARGRTAEFIGARPEDIAFLPNASSGINIAIDLFAEPGEVLVHRDEFPSVSLPWLQRGYSVRFLEPDHGGVLEVDAIADAVGPRTRYIAISALQYASGFAVDLPSLGGLCRDRGLYLFCDATQATGAIPINVGEFDPDVLVFSAYKWVCAGYGLGTLYIARRHLENRALPGAGWRSAKNAYGLANDSLDNEQQAYALEYGNPLLPAPLVMDASLTLLDSIGIENISLRLQQLGDKLRTGLTDAGRTLCSPEDLSRCGGITMFEDEDADDLAAALLQRDVHVSARQGLVRVSPHFYNDEEDIDRFLGELRRLRN